MKYKMHLVRTRILPKIFFYFVLPFGTGTIGMGIDAQFAFRTA